MRQAGELDSLKGRHWGCMERWPVGKAARGSSFAPLEKGKQTAGQGILKTEQLEGLWSIKTSPCRGILRQLHGHCRQAYHREHASWLFCASAAHLLSAKFGRICSDARRLRRRQGAPFFKASRHNVGRMGEIDRRFPISPPL